jgi:hypothetical protein
MHTNAWNQLTGILAGVSAQDRALSETECLFSLHSQVSEMPKFAMRIETKQNRYLRTLLIFSPAERPYALSYWLVEHSPCLNDGFVGDQEVSMLALFFVMVGAKNLGNTYELFRAPDPVVSTRVLFLDKNVLEIMFCSQTRKELDLWMWSSKCILAQ